MTTFLDKPHFKNQDKAMRYTTIIYTIDLSLKKKHTFIFFATQGGIFFFHANN